MSEYIPLAEVEGGRIDNPYEATALTVVYNSMLVVNEGIRTRDLRRAQAGNASDDEGSSIKDDDTLLTCYDKQSEAKAAAVMQAMRPGMPFRGEEGTRHAGKEHEFELGLDGLDGTRNFVAGFADATVLAAVYRPDGSVYGAAIGQAATGRLYSAFDDKPTEGRLIRLDGDVGRTVMHAENVRTWQGDIVSDKGQLIIDMGRVFARSGHPVLDLDQQLRLRSTAARMGIEMLEVGSNGAGQLAVAGGSERAAANLTTARGVWEDTEPGLFLTEHSGGVVSRFTIIRGVVEPASAAENRDYDVAVAANTVRTSDLVTRILYEVSHD